MAKTTPQEKWEVAHYEQEGDVCHVTKLRWVEVGEIDGKPYRRVLFHQQLRTAIRVPPKGHADRGAAIAQLKATPHGPPPRPPQIDEIEEELNAE